MLNFYEHKAYLENWHTSKEIREYLSSYGIVISDPELRKEINKFNDNYSESELFIAHSNHGFVLTTRKDLIEKSVNDIKKRAIAMFNRARQIEKAKSLKSNIKLDIPDGLEPKEDTYEIVSKIVDGCVVKVREVIRYGQ